MRWELMAWTRPAIRVFQEYLQNTPSTITPFFELCVVGPAYLVVRDKQIKNEDSLINKDYMASVDFKCGYPDIVPGCAVDLPFTEAYLEDAYVKIWPAFVTGADALTASVVIDNSERVSKLCMDPAATISNFKKAGVEVGDIIYVKVGNKVVSTTVNNYIDVNTMYLSKNVPTPQGNVGNTFSCEVTIIRPVHGKVQLAVNPQVGVLGGVTNGLIATTEELELKGTLTTTVDTVTYRIYSGKPYVTYRALRSYLASDFVQIRTQKEADGVIGTIDVANPLAIAVEKVFANASVPFKVLPVVSDDKTGYLKALDLLSTNEKVYVIVPLTQNTEIIQAYASHVKAMRMPEKSKWRIMYCNLRMPNNKVVIEDNDGVLSRIAGEDTCCLIDQADGKFGTKNAAIGDYVDIYDALTRTYQFSLMITSILNDSVAVMGLQKYILYKEGYDPMTGPNAILTPQDTAVRYAVTRKLSTYGIAQEMVNVAKSFSNRGVRIVESDEVVTSINGVDYILPGYYLAVAYGALRAGFPPHQGFTTLGISGFKQIRRSNKFFTDDDLDLMAGGGIFVVVQDSVDSLPYCIYQTTTDLTDLKSKEDSIVATVDFASMYYRDNLKAVLGKFNVNEISQEFVRNVINDVTRKMKRMTYPYIGALLIEGKLVKMTTDVDKILPVVKIDVPFPVNGVDLYLQV